MRLLPVAAALMIAAPPSAKLVARFGTKMVVTLGLVLVASALLLFSRVDGAPAATRSSPLVLVIIGVGMGLAMAPATDSIMGSLPPEKAGVGSAMNDTTREIGGALGVAILGSITERRLRGADHVTARASRPSSSRRPRPPQAVEDSVGAASVVAEPAAGRSSPSRSPRRPTTPSSTPSTARCIVGALVAVAGALVAWLFLPARAQTDLHDDVEELVDGAALRLIDDPEQRRSLARATLGLLADAGMSSLTYNGIAARSGIGTATLERLLDVAGRRRHRRARARSSTSTRCPTPAISPPTCTRT